MFDREMAILLGRACQYSYDLPKTVPGVLTVRKACKAAPPFWDSNNPRTSCAVILDYTDMRVVAFQGTITRKIKELGMNDFDAVADWLKNFDAALTTSDRFKFQVPGRVHRGFGGQLDLIYPDILKALRQDTTPIYITGHSQGGAVAAIATKALAVDGLPIAATYTFAAPRPGDAAFATSVGTEVHRLEFGDDIVPHVPMRTGLPHFFERVVAQLVKDQRAKDLLAMVGNKANFEYEPLGPLTYVAGDGSGRMFDMSARSEADLTNQRRLHMLVAGKNLGEHHHMFNYLHHILEVDLAEAQRLA